MKTYEDVIGQVPLDIAAKYPIAILMVAREKYSRPSMPNTPS